MDEWQLPRTGPVPPLVFIAPAGSREVLEADVAEPNELPRKIHTNCNGGLVLILPGGGYRKVEVEKEGRAIGRHFASQGFVCCVVDYQLGPFASFSMRASTAEPSLADAVAALEFVQTEPRSGAGTLFEASRVALCGFSAGGHLSLCLLREIARAESQVKSGCEPEPEPEPSPTPHPRPPVAALMLVYPTIRNPCCWCIAGGLWILPGYIGASWPAEAEHVSLAPQAKQMSSDACVCASAYYSFGNRRTVYRAIPRCRSCYQSFLGEYVRLLRVGTCFCQLTSTPVC